MIVVQYQRSGTILPIHMQLMSTVRRACERQNIPYTLLTQPPYCVQETEDYRYASDLIRLRLACENPGMLWIDTDTICYSIPYLPLNGRPYFQNNGIADISYFFVGNCCQYFMDLWAYYEAGPRVQALGWIQEEINKSKCQLIPRGHFQHLALSNMILDEQRTEYGTAAFTVKRINGELTLELLGGYK